jgi:hypothetical protein
LTSRRPPRTPGPRFGSNPAGGADDSPAQTNLGLLLQRAMQAAQQTGETGEQAAVEQEEIAEELRETELCANCWHATTFKDDQGRMMARCAKDLWLRPSFTIDELNNNRVRRWYANCPAYDDSE